MSESLSLAFGDARAERYGVVGLDPEAGAFAFLFAGREPVLAAPAPGFSLQERDGGWHVELGAGAGDGAALALDFAPLAAAVDRPGGGSDQPCRVSGSVRAGGRAVSVAGLGEHSRAPGGPDWDRVELTRAVTAWTGRAAASLSALRPVAARHHADETTWSALWESDEPVPVRRGAPLHDVRRGGPDPARRARALAGDRRRGRGLGAARGRRAAVRRLPAARHGAARLRVPALAHRGRPGCGALRDRAPRASAEQRPAQPREPPAQAAPAPQRAQFSDPSRSQQ